MSTYYIATTGSDTTGDGSIGNPYATTTKGVSIASTGDTISIAGGTYTGEKFSTGDKTLTFVATGAVVWNGGGVTTAPMITINTSTASRVITFTGTSTNTFTFQNYTGANPLVTQTTTNAQTANFTYCNFVGNSNTSAFYQAGNSVHTLNCSYCNFTGVFSTYVININSNATAITNVSNCSIINQTYGIFVYVNTTTVTGSTFTNCAFPIVIQGSGGASFQNNTYTGAYSWNYANTGKTWAQWQALGIDIAGSTSDSLGMTIYVNKSGNDLNTGYGKSAAKLTIQAGMNLMTTNGLNLIVGSGSYNEKVTPLTNSCNFYADGVVVLDGQGLSSGTAITLGSASKNYTFSTLTGGKWILKNYSGSYLVTFSGAGIATFSGMEFVSSSLVGTALYISDTASLVISNCIFYDFTTQAVYWRAVSVASTYIYFYNNTVYNCPLALYLYNGQNGTTAYIYYNHISTCTTGIQIAGQAFTIAPTIQYNQYYGITNWKYLANTDTTFATWQGRLTNLDFGSLGNTDPSFADTTNKIFYPTTQSSISRTQGAIPFGYVHGKNTDSINKWNIIAGAGHDNSGWYNPDGNVTKNGTTGFLELSGGTTGVIWSPVYDLGTVQAIRRVDLGVNQTWGTNMIDYDKTDTKPNYQTIEVRGSGSSFNQDDGTIGWTVVKTEQPISVVSGRYVQVRITLRSDDVAS